MSGISSGEMKHKNSSQSGSLALMTLGLQSLKMNCHRIRRVQSRLILAQSPPHPSICPCHHPRLNPLRPKDAECRPGPSLAAHLLIQYIAITIRTLTPSQNQFSENVVLVRSIHLHQSNELYARRVLVCDIFQTAKMSGMTHVFVHSDVCWACSRVVCLIMTAQMWTTTNKGGTMGNTSSIPQLWCS